MQHISQGIEQLKQQLGLITETGADEDPVSRECEACGAEVGEPCFPTCLGKALHDELQEEAEDIQD